MRYGEGHIASHSGLQAHAEPVRSASEILALVRPETQVVAIDEVQFYDGTIADVVDQLADEGKRIITAGLDMDFRGRALWRPAGTHGAEPSWSQSCRRSASCAVRRPRAHSA